MVDLTLFYCQTMHARYSATKLKARRRRARKRKDTKRSLRNNYQGKKQGVNPNPKRVKLLANVFLGHLPYFLLRR